MNSNQIRDSLKDYKDFIGVYPCDRLPRLKWGQAMIVNTDPHNRPGQHWVALHKTKLGCLEYFDSFGLPPLVPQIRKYINLSSHNSFTYSSVQLQHETGQTCGNYCIVFVKHRLLKLPFSSLLAHFTTSLEGNDTKVHRAIK